MGFTTRSFGCTLRQALLIAVVANFFFNYVTLEVLTIVTLKNVVFWDVALVKTDISEEDIASIISVTGIGKLGPVLAVTSNLSILQRNTM
jgi:hypothetical protein